MLRGEKEVREKEENRGKKKRTLFANSLALKTEREEGKKKNLKHEEGKKPGKQLSLKAIFFFFFFILIRQADKRANKNQGK